METTTSIKESGFALIGKELKIFECVLNENIGLGLKPKWLFLEEPLTGYECEEKWAEIVSIKFDDAEKSWIFHFDKVNPIINVSEDAPLLIRNPSPITNG